MDDEARLPPKSPHKPLLDLNDKPEELDEPQEIDASEDIDEAFVCCVCLDLLYKPVVLACGHFSCFWCVHKAMSGVAESHCPICRSPYRNFPAICELIHLLVLKMYPVTYKRREKQVMEEENKQKCFSPQLNNNLSNSHIYKESNSVVPLSTFSIICSPVELAQDGRIHSNGKTNTTEQNPALFLCENISTIAGEGHASFEGTQTLPAEETRKDRIHGLISVEDVLCVACKQLLVQPAVLNCGHVYCRSCIVTSADEALRCQLCQSLHPKGFLKVCLELDQLLEKIFPKEYALRREAIQLQPNDGEHNNLIDGTGQEVKQHSQSSPPHAWSFLSRLGERGSNVHFGAGCDYCGMYPIVGERYRCKDCVEKIGFDLCGECYNSSSKLPGRFNQQHTPEHKFENVKSNLRRIMMRLVSEHSEDSIPVFSDDASEDPEDGLPSDVHSDGPLEDHDGLPSHPTAENFFPLVGKPKPDTPPSFSLPE